MQRICARQPTAQPLFGGAGAGVIYGSPGANTIRGEDEHQGLRAREPTLTAPVGDTVGVEPDIVYDVWASLSQLFVDEQDDNGLPEVQIHGIPAGRAGALWDRLLRGAEMSPPDATVFLTADDREVPARDMPDLAGRAERGEVSMHVVLRDVSAGGVGLPDLGVSIHDGELDIDYAVNVWSPETMIAFLWLLTELRTLAPGSRLVAADEAGTAYDERTQTKLTSAIALLSL